MVSARAWRRRRAVGYSRRVGRRGARSSPRRPLERGIEVADLDMLRSVADFRQIQSQSRSRAHPLLLLRYRRNGLERTRYGISTSRKIGSAVVRNKVRRRLRSILRAIDGSVERGYDILLVARPAAAGVKQA